MFFLRRDFSHHGKAPRRSVEINVQDKKKKTKWSQQVVVLALLERGRETKPGT